MAQFEIVTSVPPRRPSQSRCVFKSPENGVVWHAVVVKPFVCATVRLTYGRTFACDTECI